MSQFYFKCFIFMAIALCSFFADTTSGWAEFKKENLMLRVRGIGVVPDEDSTVSVGGKVKMGNATVPEVDVTYFWTDHIATELIAAAAPHDASTTTGLDLGDVVVIPPTLTLQYHPMARHERFRPYVGAGLSYIFYVDEDAGSSITTIDYENGIGYALQAGMDIGINDHLAWNIDVKKIFHQVDVTITGPTATADVDLDPWIIGTGLAYRF